MTGERKRKWKHKWYAGIQLCPDAKQYSFLPQAYSQVGFNVRYWLHCQSFLLELKSLEDKYQKCEMTGRWGNYWGNLWKICDIIGPKPEEKMWINWLVQQGTDYQSVYSHSFLRFWTNNVKSFPKVTTVISPLTCPLTFLIFVLETF